MKRPDIVLIDPPSNHTKKVLGMPDKSGNLPHLGLLSLAAVLEREGYSVKYIDAKALGLDIQECCNEVVKCQPRYVGITSVTPAISIAANLSKMIKARLDSPIILGGVHVTAIPDDTMKRYQSFDVAVIGEGELTIVELLKAMDDNTPLGEVDGIVFRQGRDILQTKSQKLIANLDELPLPAWHLLPNLKKYYQPSFSSTKKLPSNHIITGRGCYGQCIFCDKSVVGDKIRRHGADYVIKMMDVLHNKYGIMDLQIEDDVFVDQKKCAHEICDKLIEKKWALTWSIQSRVNNIDLDLLIKMKKAGCWRISYGIESGSQEILDFIKKDITVEQVENAVKLTRQAGIKVNGFFILGLPMETKDSIMKTIELLLKLELDYVCLHFFIPYQGTWAYKIANKYGFFKDDWGKKQHNIPDVFVPHGFSIKELIYYRNKALLRFYLRPRVMFLWIMSIRSPFDALKLMLGSLLLLNRLTGDRILSTEKKR